MQSSNILILPRENCKLACALRTGYNCIDDWGYPLGGGDAGSDFLGGSLLALMMAARPTASSKNLKLFWNKDILTTFEMAAATS